MGSKQETKEHPYDKFPFKNSAIWRAATELVAEGVENPTVSDVLERLRGSKWLSGDDTKDKSRLSPELHYWKKEQGKTKNGLGTSMPITEPTASDIRKIQHFLTKTKTQAEQLLDQLREISELSATVGGMDGLIACLELIAEIKKV